MIPYKLLKHCSSFLSVEGSLPDSGEFEFNSDSRLFKSGQIFFAIPGEKFNPVDFILTLKGKGLTIAVVESNDVNKEKLHQHGITIIWTKNVVNYIQELAQGLVKDWRFGRNCVFAISGSNGKTTTKEMLSFILKTALPNKIVATEKNNNNHLGVPFTLFKITKETEVIILELGSNHPGEIKVLCDTALPDAGVVTNIGATHLEFFGSVEAVYKEEGYLYHSINQSTQGKGKFFLNMEDPYLKQDKITSGTLTFGYGKKVDFEFSFEGSKIHISGKENVVLENNHITGKHNQWNLALAWIIASTLYGEHKIKFAEICKDFKPTKNRSEWIQFKNRAVFLDAYNANPSSMKAALEGFFDELKIKGIDPKQSSLVLGDMNELGNLAQNFHQEVGDFLNKLPCGSVYFIGRYREAYQKGFPKGIPVENVIKFKNDYWPQIIQDKTNIFIKGSRSLQLESILDIT